MALSVALPLALSSCSKEQLAQPTATTPASTGQADVKAENGRLVFSNLDAFTRVQTSLGKMTMQELESWEKSLGFSSLRAAASTESFSMEKLEAAGTPAPAFSLMQSFGIPSFYAAAITPTGEYQIGSTIYWFHDGFKYAAQSETELATIKQNPSSATEKSKAGVQLVTQATPTKGMPAGAASAVQSNQLDSDDKFVSPTFNLDGDAGSQRRVIFATHIFSEYMNTSGGVGTWHSIFYLRVKVDYYSNGARKWYSADGTYRQSTYDIHFTGTAARKGYESYGSTVTVDKSNVGLALPNTRNQDYPLADVTVQAPRVYDGGSSLYDSDPAYIYWTFQLSGGLTATVGQSRPYNYNIGSPGTPLWQ